MRHSRRIITRRHARLQGGEPSLDQNQESVKNWVRETRTSEERSTRSLNLCLLGAISISLVIVTVSGARPFVSELLFKAAESSAFVQPHLKTHAVVNQVHAQARETAMAGDMNMAVGMYLKAELECDKNNPARSELLNDLGVALTASGRHQEAQRYLREAIELNPSLIAAYNNLAVSQMLAGERQEAIATLNAAVKAQPQNEYAALKLKRLWQGNSANLSSRPDQTY